ncbi:MAG: pyridoxamine 5'-phosphate oxidase [Myxococcota bacterium]
MSIDFVSTLRQDYREAPLLEEDAAIDPFEQFERWFADAQRADVREPNAMTLATVDRTGTPAARIVLLKGVRGGTFEFFTNYGSAKALELDGSGKAALCFWWAELARQVRIGGTVERVSRERSAEYFASRPRGSQIGAWASEQSTVISGRDVLEDRVRELEERFANQDVPLPEFWGGYALSPSTFEFWQGQSSRLHDRLRYTKSGHSWPRTRLSP